MERTFFEINKGTTLLGTQPNQLNISELRHIWWRKSTALLNNVQETHCVKSYHIRSFSGPYLPAFGLNAGKYGPEKLRIWMRENTDQKNSEYGHFSRSDSFMNLLNPAPHKTETIAKWYHKNWNLIWSLKTSGITQQKLSRRVCWKNLWKSLEKSTMVKFLSCFGRVSGSTIKIFWLENTWE